MSRAATSASTLVDTVNGAGLLAGSANVIMQLGIPGVGHGVVESRVESGRLFDHPYKRTRTTLTYLAVATLGNDADRATYRAAVNTAHRQVFSTPDSPVKYHAMDPGLQLWVAACLYRGFEDTYTALTGDLTAHEAEQVYQASAPLGTTLQVREEMWPATRADFETYWKESLEQVAIDDVVRGYLHSVTRLEFLPWPLSRLLGGFNQFVTTGFLPQRFRAEMRYSWSARDQERFDRMMRTIGAVTRRFPRALRELPFNVLLRDVRLRAKRGWTIV